MIKEKRKYKDCNEKAFVIIKGLWLSFEYDMEESIIKITHQLIDFLKDLPLKGFELNDENLNKLSILPKKYSEKLSYLKIALVEVLISDIGINFFTINSK